MDKEIRLKLDRRIHNQRVALRENWMITEMRRTGFAGSGAAERWRNHALKLYRENVDLKAALAKHQGKTE